MQIDVESSGQGCPKTDSRTVVPGDTFIAVKGEKQDGGAFVAAAIAAGAVKIVSEDPPPETLPDGVVWLRVPDSRAAAARLACEGAGNPSRSLAVFGVTGTNGKTTVANLVRTVLEAGGVPCGLLSTIENDAFSLSRSAPVQSSNTTPGPVELQGFFKRAAMNGCRAVSMEVSSHALAQRRTDGTVFKCAVFTNLTQDHLDYHKTMEAYAAAKRRLFFPEETEIGSGTALAPPLSAVFNIDDGTGAALFSDWKRLHPSLKSLSYGFGKNADIRISNLKLAPGGMEFDLSAPAFDTTERVHSRLMGRFNALNFAAAFGAALCAGIDPRTALGSLCSAAAVRGRLEPVQCPSSPASFFVDYAHTPDALANALATLRELVGLDGRLFVVFGAGGDRDRAKRPLMGEVCAKAADRLIVTSDNPRSEPPGGIIDEVLAGIAQEKRHLASAVIDRADAIRESIRAADRPGDIVLVAGKGHETYQIFADRTVHFDDREAIERGLR